MIVTASIGNILGCVASFIFSGMALTNFILGRKHFKNKDAPLKDMFLGMSLLTSIGFGLVPFGFIIMAYLERNPHMVDFLRFT